MKNLKNKMNNKGFSLVELLVVVAIMVVLVGVIAPSLLGNIEKSKESKDIQTLDSIASACQAAMADPNGFDIATKLGAGDAAGTYANNDVTLAEIAANTDAFAKAYKEYMKTAPTLDSKAGAAGTVYIHVNADSNTVTVYSGSAKGTANTISCNKLAGEKFTVTR